MNTKVAIIGAGPAGTAAAIQLRRSKIGFTLFEKCEIGGLIKSANIIENMPTFPKGISGVDVTALLSKSLANLDIKPTHKKVLKLNWRDDKFAIETSTRTYQYTHTIVASGTLPRNPDINIPANCNLIHNEITNLKKTNNKSIAIIGSGDAAFDYALNLAKTNKTTILIRNKPKCIPILLERAENNKNIDIVLGIATNKIEIQNNSILLIANKDNETFNLNFDYTLFAIGRTPNKSFISMNENTISGLALSKHLFFAGDVKNDNLRQYSIAIGDGMKAAMEISRANMEQ